MAETYLHDQTYRQLVAALCANPCEISGWREHVQNALGDAGIWPALCRDEPAGDSVTTGNVVAFQPK